MKFAVKILATFAIIILLTSSGEAAELKIDAEKIFVEQANPIPSRVRRPFTLPIRTPRKDYSSRIPARPSPRYLPSKPKLSRDNRGGNRKKFVPPQSSNR